jgi:hypothetical protein
LILSIWLLQVAVVQVSKVVRVLVRLLAVAVQVATERVLPRFLLLVVHML